MKPQIVLTDAACDHIKTLLLKNQGIGFRLSIKEHGCSGYSYDASIVHHQNETDIVCDVQPEIRIFLDAKWGTILNGVIIDYVEEVIQGLKQKRLLFSSSHESGKCGCGKSFHVHEKLT